jgi:hypothetical protein
MSVVAGGEAKANTGSNANKATVQSIRVSMENLCETMKDEPAVTGLLESSQPSPPFDTARAIKFL